MRAQGMEDGKHNQERITWYIECGINQERPNVKIHYSLYVPH